MYYFEMKTRSGIKMFIFYIVYMFISFLQMETANQRNVDGQGCSSTRTLEVRGVSFGVLILEQLRCNKAISDFLLGHVFAGLPPGHASD